MAADYFSHEQNQRKAAQEAWKDFSATLPKNQRRMLDRLPSADGGICAAAPDVDVSNSMASSCFMDLARLDSLEDVLREGFGLDAGQAQRLAAWHRDTVQREAEMAKADQLARIIGVLIRPMHDVRAVISGLALAAGITGQTALHEVSSGADLARKLGKHRATLSYWKRCWQKLLDLKNETFGKSDDAKAKYREARRMVIERGRNGEK